MGSQINRRTFIKQSASIGAGFTIVNSGILKAGQSPNGKLNIAIIGVAGRGGANLNGEDCRCRKDQMNDRFEILKGLKLEK